LFIYKNTKNHAKESKNGSLERKRLLENSNNKIPESIQNTNFLIFLLTNIEVILSIKVIKE
jgi:hypothetical protein